MKPYLNKVVSAIFRKMREQPDWPPSENRLRHWLSDQGYSNREIEDAMRLIGGLPEWSAGRTPDRETFSTRVLTVFEECKVTPEARNALTRLEFHGLIDGQEREMVLERLNHFDGEVGLDEMDYLVAWVVCSNRNVEAQQTIYAVLENEPSAYH